MSDLIRWEEARDRVLAGVAPLPARSVPVLGAHGRYLAESVVAPESMPPFDNSGMDGFGVLADEVREASVERPTMLAVVGNLPAGESRSAPVAPGRAVRVMTVAPIPEGADAVVPVEYTNFWDEATRRARIPDSPEEAAALRVFRPVPEGANIRRTGESVRAGDRFLEPGHKIRGTEVALLISVGVARVNVHSLPRIGVLSTGDELVAAGETPGPGQIRDSNRAALLLRLKELGFEAVDLGLVHDDPKELESRIRDAIPKVDFLITSGGVSVGDRDFTREVLGRMGNVEAYRVAVKPGKPQVFGHIGTTPVFGLPGNPVSSLVVCDHFVVPALLKMAGAAEVLPARFEAELTMKTRHKPGRTEFLRVRLVTEAGRWLARGTGPRGSGILSSMTKANGYAIIPAEAETLEPGARVLCQWMH